MYSIAAGYYYKSIINEKEKLIMNICMLSRTFILLTLKPGFPSLPSSPSIPGGPLIQIKIYATKILFSEAKIYDYLKNNKKNLNEDVYDILLSTSNFHTNSLFKQ